MLYVVCILYGMHEPPQGGWLLVTVKYVASQAAEGQILGNELVQSFFEMILLRMFAQRD